MKGALCGKNHSKKAYRNKCYCNALLCLVNGTRSNGEVYKTGKPVCYKCRGDVKGDIVTAKNDCIKEDIDCEGNKINRNAICKKFGLQSAKKHNDGSNQ